MLKQEEEEEGVGKGGVGKGKKRRKGGSRVGSGRGCHRALNGWPRG